MINLSPIAAPRSVNVVAGTSVAAASFLASVFDAEGDSIRSYAFFDNGAGGGRFLLNGVVQPAGKWIVVSAADLANLTYQGGAAAGAERIYVAAHDGTSWSPTATALATTSVNRRAVVRAAAVTVSANQAVAASSFIRAVSDADGDAIAKYSFFDTGIGGGHFMLDGVAQAASRWITVDAADLARLTYVGGANSGRENILVRAFDGKTWSTDALAFATTVNHAPVVAAAAVTVSANQAVAASSFIRAVVDADGDTITKYGFYDAGIGGGRFMLDGVAQGASRWITVEAADLARLTYVGGANSGREGIYVRAFDGKAWSTGVSVVATTINHAPIVAAAAVSVEAFAAVSAASLVSSATDADGDAIKRYAFMDTGVAGGYFLLNGIKQLAGRWIVVDADKVGALSYVGGKMAGTETIRVMASDGKVWSTAVATTVTTTPAANDPWGVLVDAGIKADVVRLVSGSALTYTGMLQILQDAAVGGVTASEFTTLRTLDGLLNASGGITVSAYVDDISSRLVNGDPGNRYWTGGSSTHVALGNLAAGATETQMDRLIGKWFLGTDRPTASGTYKVDTDPLYGSSGAPSYLDVNQGALGDCYLLAAMGQVALNDPAIIQSMLTDNGNGTYGVRFFVDGLARYVTVDSQLPYDTLFWDNGSYLEYANGDTKWAGLIEKAYVQLNASGAAAGQLAGNDYALIAGGWFNPLTEITGKSVTTYWSTDYVTEADWEINKTSIVEALAAGQEVLVGTGSIDSGNLVGDHMYEVTGYDTGSGNFMLHNPWGSAYSGGVAIDLQVSMADLFTNQATVGTTTGRALA